MLVNVHVHVNVNEHEHEKHLLARLKGGGFNLKIRPIKKQPPTDCNNFSGVGFIFGHLELRVE